jgi:hypothetical protein
MKTNPILEEVWRIKNELAHEAGNDLHQLCENTRKWAAAHSHSGPALNNAEELRRFLADQDAATPALREEPPAYGDAPRQK